MIKQCCKIIVHLVIILTTYFTCFTCVQTQR